MTMVALIFLALALFWHQPVSAQNPFDKLCDAYKAEMAKRNGRLKIALDWPEADTVNVFPEFKKSFPFIREILYTREGDVGPFANYLIRIKRGEFPEFDIMHAAGEFEIQYKKEGRFGKPPLRHKELRARLPTAWTKPDPPTRQPNGYFTGPPG